MTKKGFIFLLVAIGLITFFNALFNGFVWDDEEQILNNVLVHSILNFPNFFAGSTFNTGGSGALGGLYYKPMMTIFFSLIYTFFGANPFFFHFVQIALHIASSIFVFLIFRYFFIPPKRDLISFIPALIFLVHPINVEAVVYISCLQDILFFFFGIIALWLIVSKRLNSFKKYLLFFTLLLCSLLSKETGVLFIILITVYVVLFSRKLLKPYLITAFSSVAVYSFLRFIIAGVYFNKHGLTPISTLPFLGRLQSVPEIIIFYFKTFIYPINLSISQHWIVKSASFQDFYLPLLFLSLLLILFTVIFFVLRVRKNPYSTGYLFFLIWLLIGFFLHSQVVFPLDMTVSERWFYFPMVGLLGMCGIMFTQIKFNRFTKKGLSIVLIIFIIFLITRTMIRNANWKDGLSLYSHDILISTNTFDLENNFGVELYRAGRFDEAEQHFAASTKLAPNWWTNWSNLGVMMERKKDIVNATYDYQKAIDNGKYYLAYQNLAKIYLAYETPEKTKLFCEQSLKTLPDNSVLWFVLSIAEYKLKNTDKALVAAKNAYGLDQNQQNAYIYNRLVNNLPLEGQ